MGKDTSLNQYELELLMVTKRMDFFFFISKHKITQKHCADQIKFWVIDLRFVLKLFYPLIHKEFLSPYMGLKTVYMAGR